MEMNNVMKSIRNYKPPNYVNYWCSTVDGAFIDNMLGWEGQLMSFRGSR